MSKSWDVLDFGLCAGTGTRYIFVGKLYERRPSYHLLGVLLFVQLGISAGSWALSNLTASLGHSAPLDRNTDVGAHTSKALRAAVVLQVSLSHSFLSRVGHLLEPLPSAQSLCQTCG